MASKVKEIHQYDGMQWGAAVPIGADASNVDVKTSDNTDVSLQSVLGSFNATEPSIKTQINGKVDKEGGDVAHAVINDPVNEIPIYDLDTEETSEKLISDDISTDTDMVVMSGDGENLTTMWGKFNRFRKRVDNKFKNYLVTSIAGVTPGASSDTKGYSTQALNNYFSDVIGYTSAASVAQTGSVASQLSSLNSNVAEIYNSYSMKCEIKIVRKPKQNDNYVDLYGICYKANNDYRAICGITALYTNVAVTISSAIYGGYRSNTVTKNWPANFWNSSPLVTLTPQNTGGVWVNNLNTVSANSFLVFFSAGASITRTFTIQGMVFGNIPAEVYNSL